MTPIDGKQNKSYWPTLASPLAYGQYKVTEPLNPNSANCIWDILIEIESQLLKHESKVDKTEKSRKSVSTVSHSFPFPQIPTSNQSILPPPHFNTSIKKLSYLT